MKKTLLFTILFSLITLVACEPVPEPNDPNNGGTPNDTTTTPNEEPEPEPMPVLPDFVVTPEFEGIMIEGVSPNGKYVAGSTEESLLAVMDVETGKIAIMDMMTLEGSYLHAVNNNGVAVGSYVLFDSETLEETTVPVVFDSKTGDYSVLAGEGNADPWAISTDGNTIVGFYYPNWINIYACVWTNNGQTRTNLPIPTKAELGFSIANHAQARNISADGNTILGYVTDGGFGTYVAMVWQKEGNEYKPNLFCKDYFQIVEYDNNGQMLLPAKPNPYIIFAPTDNGLSANGEWVALAVTPYDTDKGWAARYNLKNNTLEVLEEDAVMFAIANDGTAVGVLGDLESAETAIWRAGESTPISLMDIIAERYPNEEAPKAWLGARATAITSDGRRVAGFAYTADGLQGFTLKIKD